MQFALHSQIITESIWFKRTKNMLSCGFSTHALYGLCVFLVESLSCEAFLFRNKRRANDTKPNVRLIKIPIQCIGYMVFGSEMSLLSVPGKYPTTLQSMHSIISPEKHSTKRAHGALKWMRCVGATANVSSLHTQVCHCCCCCLSSLKHALHTPNAWCLINIHTFDSNFIGLVFFIPNDDCFILGF